MENNKTFEEALTNLEQIVSYELTPDDNLAIEQA